MQTLEEGDSGSGSQNIMNSPTRTLDMREHYSSELSPYARQQMQYNSKYVEDVNSRMQMPSKLTVAYQDHDALQTEATHDTSYSMEVPDRIVVAVGDGGVHYSGPTDVSASHFNQDLQIESHMEPVSLLTPPRKLTLAERNLDALDVQDHQEKKSLISSSSNQQEDSSHSDEQDVTLLQSHIFKLHRRITTIEKEQLKRSNREKYMYVATAMLLLVNSWLLYTSRRT